MKRSGGQFFPKNMLLYKHTFKNLAKKKRARTTEAKIKDYFRSYEQPLTAFHASISVSSETPFAFVMEHIAFVASLQYLSCIHSLFSTQYLKWCYITCSLLSPDSLSPHSGSLKLNKIGHGCFRWEAYHQFASQFNSYLCSKKLRFILEHVGIRIIFSATVFSPHSIHNAASTSLCIITTVHLKSRSRALKMYCNLSQVNSLDSHTW